jgi:predicted Rossmann fold flavoprotein
VAIVGAGAAGLATAIFTRRFNSSLSVAILDGARKPGAKILVSGGSRCNVTNTVVHESDFWGGRRTIIRRVLRAFPVDETIAFFRGIGVTLHEEPDGKLFPDSNRARDVLDALLRELEEAGARLLAGHRVVGVDRVENGFEVETTSGRIASRALVLATGGRSLPRSGSDGAGYGFAQRFGHTIVAPTPGLAPLVLADENGLHRDLTGVSHEAELTVQTEPSARNVRLRGSLLWTHFGISGPLALNASRHWARATLEGRRPLATLNFAPGQRFEDLDRGLVTVGVERPKASVHAALGSLVPHLPASAVAGVISRSGIERDAALSQLPREDRRRLAHAVVEWTLSVVDTRGYNYAEVTAGGVDLAEIDPSTMESRRTRGLFLVGEILDVDGRIGGFNFQWAWSSARVAARALAARVQT